MSNAVLQPGGSPGELTGGCTCRRVHYQLTTAPLFVHCCHCTWCQRESGSAFAVNALVESRHVLVEGETQLVPTPSASGKGQQVARCPTCRVALWSHYGGAGEAVSFVRVGTLDEPARVPPDIHIYVSTRLPWVQLPADVPQVQEYYRRSDYWPPESQARWRDVVAQRSV